MTPLVTCLCLTRQRPAFLRAAVACFLAQTYAPRELLIAAEHESDLEGVDLADRRILLRYAPEGLCVGEKRNWACARAQGDLIAHWDDDDFSGPERLAHQAGRLKDTGKAVTGFHTMKFTDGARWAQYRGNWPGFAFGTSLCYRRDWWQAHPFACEQRGQDEQFAMHAASQRQLDQQPDLDLMYATNHAPGHADLPRDMRGPAWHACEASPLWRAEHGAAVLAG